MDVSDMLSGSGDGHLLPGNGQVLQGDHHPYPTRQRASFTSGIESQQSGSHINQAIRGSALSGPNPSRPKTVSFELMVDEARKARARLPMRVQIHPHDSTEDIIASVKGFFGIYDDRSLGVSFEDNNGINIIATYENFTNNSTVSVRVIPVYSTGNDGEQAWGYRAASPQRLRGLEESAPILPPPQPAQILNYGQPPPRPMSRVSRKESVSPKPANSRLHGSSKSRSRSGIKGQTSSFQAGLDELNDAHNGYSSSDGIAASVSSRKARSEHLATAEISVDNIVEGGRRKRAKFESSELPLFVPPQIPAPTSISSVSPQRRSNGMEIDSPFARPQQRTFTYQVPVQSPSTDTFGPPMTITPRTSGSIVPPVLSHSHRLRDRSSGASYSNRSSLGSAIYPKGHNVLPTPDPTIASCISDEDVAIQLMRLGESTNFPHGRQSASTFEDSLSGRADAASSESDSSNDEEEADEPRLPVVNAKHASAPGAFDARSIKKESNEVWPSTDGVEPSGDEVDDDYEDSPVKSESDEHNRKRQKTSKVRKLSVKPAKLPKALPNGKKVKANSISGTNLPMSPVSGPSQSRKASIVSTNMSHALGPDEDDLSSKPRCQRCRKSKKGCDRQRPCGRCKDAGIGIEGCISEDEGNGRKGRYGRHMGVVIKKNDCEHTAHEHERGNASLSGPITGTDSKKRKRV